MKVTMHSGILELILESAKNLHPRETILLLRGKASKDSVNVTEVLIPPLATYGKSFSSFPMHLLPIDFSIVGTAHSHPSGSARPSIDDQNHAMGKITFIVAYPYMRKEDAAAYDRDGRKLELEVT